MKRFTIHCEVFKVDHFVQFGGTVQSAVDEYCKRVNKRSWTVDDDDLDAMKGVCFSSHPLPSCGVWFSEEAEVGTIVHECFHLVHHVANVKGMKLSNASEEWYAYYLTWVFDSVYKRWMSL